MAICAFADPGPRRADPHDLQASQIVQKLELARLTRGEWQKSPDPAFGRSAENDGCEPKRTDAASFSNDCIDLFLTVGFLELRP